ncbi:MAG TPA: aminopeptidase P N-terminal domain-containing protein [Bacteroidota bacterium]|nr:aminopeptidase P N-terminal domain-containing protein [Bacteroidota bacterium]
MRLRLFFFAVAVSLVFTIPALCQDLRYLLYDKDDIAPGVYKARRQQLLRKLGDSSVAFFVSAIEKSRNGDGDYPYRQDDNFYYLTGFKEPHAVLVLSGRGILLPSPTDTARVDTVHEILFVQPRDKKWEQWTGRRFGPDGAMALCGVEAALVNDRLAGLLPVIVPPGKPTVLYVAQIPAAECGAGSELTPLRDKLDSLASQGSHREPSNPTPIIDRMRSIKDSSEIALITKAAHISAMAHRRAMTACTPGMTEYQIQAEYEYVFRSMGSEANAYPCIVGAAENSIVLHYESNRRPIAEGDLVLADCGAEYHYYASDLTRTYPADGTFSPAQGEIYQLVLDAQKGAIALMKPGAHWRDVTAKADSILREGLFALGIIKEKSMGELRRFFPHGLGHAVGLDVHDINASVLEPGMIVTVEPGIYIPEEAQGVDRKYFNIGVRIEDDILITQEGNVNLTDEAPREIADIERLMHGKKTESPREN